MRSLESEKVCQSLTVENRMFVCPKSKQRSGQILTAPCMADPHAGAYLSAKMCDLYRQKGGDTNGTSSNSKKTCTQTKAADVTRV